MSEELREELGLLVDKAENYLAATNLPLPPQTHVQGLIFGIREIRDRLRKILESQESRRER